jgi:O-acetyl-ADP-ribose deacetylase (regulator of RNase III)
MTEIRYLKGDATDPQGEGRKIICHVCNDIGKWGKGFVVALSRRWPITRTEYLKWYRSRKGFRLGAVQFVKVETDIVVANMVGQHDIKTKNKIPPIRYSAVAKALEKVGIAAMRNNASVHCPRFGAGLAGGRWKQIEKLLNDYVCSRDIQVTVYDLP